MDPRIRPVGRWLATRPDGSLINEARLELVPHGWRLALDEVIQVYRAELGPALHSVWVRGSAVRGTAVLGVSDLDTVALAHLPPTTPGEIWLSLPAIGEAIQGIEAPGCTGIEAEVASLGIAMNTGRGRFLRFLLATQSTRATGQSIAHRPYVVDANIRFVAPALPGCLDQARAELPELAHDPDEVRSLTRWVAKTIVRAGLDLVLLDEGRYTRDLWPCYDAFPQRFPDRSADMAAALTAALFPEPDPAQLRALLTGIGPWLQAALADV